MIQVKVVAIVRSISNYVGTTESTAAVKGMDTWSVLPSVTCAGNPNDLES